MDVESVQEGQREGPNVREQEVAYHAGHEHGTVHQTHQIQQQIISPPPHGAERISNLIFPLLNIFVHGIHVDHGEIITGET